MMPTVPPSRDLCAPCQNLFASGLPMSGGTVAYKCSRSLLRQSRCPMCTQIQAFVDKTDNATGTTGSDNKQDGIEVHFRHVLQQPRRQHIPSQRSTTFWDLKDPDPRSQHAEKQPSFNYSEASLLWQYLAIMTPENANTWLRDTNDVFLFTADHGTSSSLFPLTEQSLILSTL